jgi:ankyrin repeat protein
MTPSPHRFPRPTLLPLLLALQLSAGCRQKSDEQTETQAAPGSNPPPGSSEPAAKPVEQKPFFDASLNGDLEAVREAIARQTDVNQTDADGRTALMLACFNGHTAICKELLAAKAEVDVRDKTGRTALMYAATGANEETVSLLVEHKADVNLSDGGEHWTPLMFAAAEGQTGVARILLAAGADADAKDVDGEDAVMFARDNGHAELAQMISEAK